MRYSPELYAKSLFEVLEASKPSEHDTVFKKFLQTVEKNGDYSRVNAITASFEKLVIKSNGGKMIDIETAREIDKDMKAKLSKMFGANDLIKTSINPRLVAGVRVELDEELELDYSLARKFRKLFTEKI
jgi:F0F1-type ATP synthase delta subunit